MLRRSDPGVAAGGVRVHDTPQPTMGCKSSSLSYPDSDGVTTFQEQMKV